MKNILMPLGIIALLGAGVVALSQIDIFTQSEKVSEGVLADTTIAQGDSTQQTSAPAPTIQDKMLNAIDYYKDIKGTFTVYLKPISVDETVTFEVKQGDAPRSFVQTKSKKSDDAMEYYFDGQYFLTYDKKKAEFIKEKRNVSPNFDKSKERKFTLNGQPAYVYRPDPSQADMAKDIVFPQVYAFWLDEQSQYKIVSYEQFVGRDAVVIEGKMDSQMSRKHDAETFKMWIDNETGVLLKLIETNVAGEITNKIEVLELKVNAGVDESKFSTIPPAGAKDKSIN